MRRLAGLAPDDGYELERYPDPLAPATAARLAGRAALDLASCVPFVKDLGRSRQLVLVEGAGGLLVRFDDAGQAGTTLADLAVLLAAPVLVVVDPGLGTLNQTALTLEALAARGLVVAGVLLGSWPGEPDLACRANVTDLEILAGGPLAGALPAGLGRCHPPSSAPQPAGRWGRSSAETSMRQTSPRKHASTQASPVRDTRTPPSKE